MSEESRVVGVRMKVSMQEQLARLAKKNDRSLCREIIRRLRESLEQEARDAGKQSV
ncbi:Arc family DNA-binding protein [Pseudomonas sp.]|uniref:Arc family DNA-binding protein n=1 Tax=Pseudomonas sp. TaxID=306 RepID=UPI00258FF38D|nr:Arc family DNA-binding protein [Pseudomonas sp.]